MEKYQRDFIDVLKAAFSTSKTRLPDNFDYERAVHVAKKHNIVPILFYGAMNCNVSQNDPYMDELFQLTLQSAMVSMQQTYEVEQIVRAFEAEKIKYMLLKGSILKNLYPKPEMRTMGDADILIDMEQYSKVASLMEQLQFTFKKETDHEMIWSKPTLLLELHKRIMTTYNKDYYRYYGNGWGLAHHVANSSHFVMSPEDFYIFIFVHFTKHYRISGIGIKHLIDLWVYVEGNQNLNWNYIEKELGKLQLSQFHFNIRKTISVWFEGGTDTNVSDLITSVIFNSGEYGTAEMAIINRSLQKGKNSSFKIKAYQVLYNIFLPYKEMKKRYAVLNKLPVLLPFMWVVRFFDITFRHKSRVKSFMRKINKVDSSQIKGNEQALHIVGLDFFEH